MSSSYGGTACESAVPGTDREPAAAQTSSDTRAIKDAIAAYLAALERGDAATASEYWDPDSRTLGPGMDLDHTSSLAFIRSTFAAGTRVDILVRRTIELDVYGEFAYEIAQAEEVFIPGGQAKPDTLRNNIFVRWKRGGDGKWRFNRVLVGPQAVAASTR